MSSRVACQEFSQPMPEPTATMSSTRSTCTAAWFTQTGRAPVRRAVGLDLVVRGRGVEPVDDEHGLAVEVADVDERGGRQPVAGRDGDMVDRDSSERHRRDPLGLTDGSPHDADGERARSGDRRGS